MIFLCFLLLLGEESYNIPFFGMEENNYNLFNWSPSMIPESTTIVNGKIKRLDPTLLGSLNYYGIGNDSSKYLFILGHYEQLGKTTINLMQAGVMAAYLNRNLVMPYVRNSRYCGLPEGWTGSKRKKSREFFPIENYFDYKSVVNIFRENRFASLSNWNDFHQQCKSTQDTLMIFFLYDGAKSENLKYMKLSSEEYEDIQSQMKANNGWTDCTMIESRIQTSIRLRNISITKAICIDPEVITALEELNSLINEWTCVIIFIWRGMGYQRTQFNLTLPLPFQTYLSRIRFSHFVYNEANQFVFENFRNQQYLSVHIRAERQLIWYSFEKYKRCLDLLIKVVNLLVTKKSIRYIFLSSDLERHGSDSFTNSTIYDKAKSYLNLKIDLIKATVYKPLKSRGLVYNDAGFVALVELEILSRSRHLVTLGAGTFQGWLIELFKKRIKRPGSNWSLCRVCSTELKNNEENSKIDPKPTGEVENKPAR